MKLIKYSLIGLMLIGSLVQFTTIYAGEVEIKDVKAEKHGANWTFSVTLLHKDTGWQHYADAWRVVSESGEIFATRTLFHPHENEQPFTRSLSDIKIPDNVKVVYIEAHDKVHGWSKQRYKFPLN